MKYAAGNKDMDQKEADSAKHTEPITQELIAETARERFGIPSLFPYQQLVITNILEANRALASSDKRARNPGNVDCDNMLKTGAACCTQPCSETSFDNTPLPPPEPYIAPAKQIVILPTGLGKSLCFMLPALLMDGITLIIFPLLALIEDQSRRVQELGEEPAVLRGGQSSEEREQIWRRLENRETRFILTNPEMLQQPKILKRIQQLPLAHLVIDETHTVSEWGDTFRPSYLELTSIQRELQVPQVTAFTATASPRIVERLKEIIFPDDSAEELNIIKADPDRPNIRYRVLPSISKDHDLTVMTAPDSPLERPLIVFCPTRATAERTARMLALRHLDPEIRFYHAGLAKEAKKEIEEWFFGSDNGILCCTTAYGMGVDKKNIRTIIHHSLPPTVESYLQESGRAGRDRKKSLAVLLLGTDDRKRALGAEDDAAASRTRELFQVMISNGTCRRTAMLALLGAEHDSCSGCDVCTHSVITQALGEKEIMEAVKSRPNRFTLGQWSDILSCSRKLTAFSYAYWRIRRFGALLSWYPDDVRQALESLSAAGCITASKRRLYKGVLKAEKNTFADYLFSECRIQHKQQAISINPKK